MKILMLTAAAMLPLLGQTITSPDGRLQLFEQDLRRAQLLNESSGQKLVKGKPLSATEERHSLQVLGDGTRIENMQSTRFYRDSEGRTRVEEMNGAITINDPVAHARIELDPSAKTARRLNAIAFFLNSANNGAMKVQPFEFGYNFSTQLQQPVLPAGVTSETTEKLGPETVNGVSAEGIRTTMIIPKGQIGNNRDIKIVNEQWTSKDVEILVKSSNSDPRFGDTTYQLTKITRSEPDPALFQIPAGYSVINQPGRGPAESVLKLFSRPPAPKRQ